MCRVIVARTKIEIDEEHDENGNVCFLQFGEDVVRLGRQKNSSQKDTETKRKGHLHALVKKDTGAQTKTAH